MSVHLHYRNLMGQVKHLAGKVMNVTPPLFWESCMSSLRLSGPASDHVLIDSRFFPYRLTNFPFCRRIARTAPKLTEKTVPAALEFTEYLFYN